MEQSINAMRFLGVDAINKANSGHPGIVLGAAPIMYSLFTRHLRVTPSNPTWFNRDRFILAAGHGSALLYSTLHLSGYKVSIDDLKEFRQLNSITPGHPEYLHTEGIDATSGPLGQGIAMATGMAIAESYLAAKYNKDKLNVVDHYTFALCGDGDLQEGVTLEAMSLAGHLKLKKLIVLYDSNDIQLDGPTNMATSENSKQKFESMGWHYIEVKNANTLFCIDEAIEISKGVNAPSIIEIKSVIGYGSTNQGDSSTHGAPLGKEETVLAKKRLKYNYGEFEAPDSAYDDFKKNVKERGDKEHAKWEKTFAKYQKKYPELAAELQAIIEGKLSVNYDEVLPEYDLGVSEASRVTGGRVISAISKALPTVIGGSADLTKSTKAKGIDGDFTKDNRTGRNINFGVREHAMGAIVNGLTLHKLRGFSGAFFVFSDYMKPAIRMASIMNIPSIFVFTHDSVAVGEDGPTHEPIEQLSMFRTMPNLNLYRPADANETNHAFKAALESTTTPSVIVLSRQNLEVKSTSSYSDFSKGAYVASDKEDFEGILLAAGSEVGLAIDTQELLAKEGILVRVVSMPSMDLFKAQPASYQEKILPKKITKRLAIEMGSPDLWYRYSDTVKGIETYGVSAPGGTAIKHFGFTKEEIASLYKKL